MFCNLSLANAQHAVCCYAGWTEETSASSIYLLQLRLDRFIIDFVLNLIITILIGFSCRADCFSNTGTAASRDRWAQSPYRKNS
jgi:hypothetical protein